MPIKYAYALAAVALLPLLSGCDKDGHKKARAEAARLEREGILGRRDYVKKEQAKADAERMGVIYTVEGLHADMLIVQITSEIDDDIMHKFSGAMLADLKNLGFKMLVVTDAHNRKRAWDLDSVVVHDDDEDSNGEPAEEPVDVPDENPDGA
jgi:hypothetical protein